ncbi:tumor necrosis factor receptor superfamily member 1A isoform X2 [Echeneis naucrates]|uniref:tumor necrosis factor receptor superfamily member 1A isoform X2 n=1 Tax=Echeneis naucrates TaxID=173247 RepID=UPI0011133CAA|nr:tumor necrosis factor receptor superfamily member 1A isoform X2 [Echeneis naucrates]
MTSYGLSETYKIMGGAWHRIRWNKKAFVGTVLLLMCLFDLAVLQASKEKKCPDTDYLSENGICCDQCPKGYKLIEQCHAPGQRSNCTPCPTDQYMENRNFYPNCRSCKRCKRNEIPVTPCQPTQNTICQCVKDYYKFDIDGDTYECRKCKQCGVDEKEKQSCTPESNTVCECKEKYYRFKNKCEPCERCTKVECEHLCNPVSPTTMPTKGDGPDQSVFPGIIAGVGISAFILMILMVVITHVTTKKLIKREMLTKSSQSTDLSPDSCEIPFVHKNMEDNTVKINVESPVNEQQFTSLPDFVPLGIKTPHSHLSIPPAALSDLLYTVLDLVPIQKVKQLVRSLGVTDTEIAQAEMDNRYCREAHYQMLRVWAERKSLAGVGGQGELFDCSLMQELLDKLRKMDLGLAVQELETKYGTL